MTRPTVVASERSTRTDPETGCVVTEWTTHPSNHLYFTNPGWFDGGRQMVFTSDRPGRPALAVLDLESGQQRLLCQEPGTHPYQTAVDPDNDRAFTWIGGELVAIDCHTGDRERLFTVPDGYHPIIPNVTADRKKVCFGITQDVGDLGFDAHFEARPRSQVLVYDLAHGTTEVVHERDVWIGHINTSPGDPNLISFCHEGPWTRVENRVWCCDLRDGRTWRVRPVEGPPACVGHEYWLADGRRIAYHGYNRKAAPVLGIADVHTGQITEFEQPVKTKHSHSLDGVIIVGDGSEQLPWILAWRFAPGALRGPWKVCRHDGGWSEQRRHVHPRVAPDNETVWFTSDRSGQPRLYSVRLPELLDALPPAPAAAELTRGKP